MKQQSLHLDYQPRRDRESWRLFRARLDLAEELLDSYYCSGVHSMQSALKLSHGLNVPIGYTCELLQALVSEGRAVQDSPTSGYRRVKR